MRIAKITAENEASIRMCPLPPIHLGQKVYTVDRAFEVTEYMVTEIIGDNVSVTDGILAEPYELPFSTLNHYWYADKLSLESAIQRLLEEVKKELL